MHTRERAQTDCITRFKRSVRHQSALDREQCTRPGTVHRKDAGERVTRPDAGILQPHEPTTPPGAPLNGPETPATDPWVFVRPPATAPRDATTHGTETAPGANSCTPCSSSEAPIVREAVP